MRNGEWGLRNVKTMDSGFLLGSLLLLSLFCAGTALADIKTIEADSTYIMGDNDNKIDARRIVLQEAKRKALEIAGTFAESLTEVKNYQLTRDEIKSYTAGIVETAIIAEELRGTAQRPEMYLKVACNVDTDRLLNSIKRYRENEELKGQLATAAKEKNDLKRYRDKLVKQLAAEKNKSAAEKTRKKLAVVLTREETNEETLRIWHDLAYKLIDSNENDQDISPADLEKNVLNLQRVIEVNPQNHRARFLLAGLYQKQGNYQAAEQQIRICIQRNPSNPNPHLKLGILLKQRGKNQEALKEFHFVERLRPHDSIMLYNTGMILKDLKRCGMSTQYLQRFLKSGDANRVPYKKAEALQAIQECGGARGGYKRRAQSS